MKDQRDHAREQTIVKRYQAGESAVEIAKSLGIVKRTVYNALQRAGVTARQTFRVTTPEQEKIVIARYLDGETADEIAPTFDFDRATVFNILKRNNVDTRRQVTRLGKEQRRAAAEMCSSGATVGATAARFGIGESTVAAILREHDISLPLGRPRYCEVNEGAFDVLTPSALYWIGVFFADGCVHTDKYGSTIVALGFAERDRAHLELYRNFIGSTHSIYRQVGGIAKTPFVTLHVRSDRLGNALKSRGILAKKIRVPVDELMHSRDFWRGCIDGDGSLGVTQDRYPYIRLFGQIPLLERFREFLLENALANLNIVRVARDRTDIYQIETSGRPADRIITTLYENVSVNEVLARKNKRAQAIIVGDLQKFPPYIEESAPIDIEAVVEPEE